MFVVSCGYHRAENCEACVSSGISTSSCQGDCHWDDEIKKCIDNGENDGFFDRLDVILVDFFANYFSPHHNGNGVVFIIYHVYNKMK